MKRYFGLDIAGYSSGKSGLAEIRTSDEITIAIVYRHHPFATPVQGNRLLAEVAEAESKALRRLVRLGVVLVDVPLDISPLTDPESAHFVWELTARPVDYALGGLRPLADRIGSSVARFRNLLRTLPNHRIIETYPAASLEATNALLEATKLPWKDYKGQIISWDVDHWIGDSLAEIARGMRLIGTSGDSLTDDDVDAILCAFAGAAPPEARIQDASLQDFVTGRLRKKVREEHRALVEDLRVPSNYQLFKGIPTVDIRVEVQDWKDFQDEAV